jgi:hypothetical protein
LLILSASLLSNFLNRKEGRRRKTAALVEEKLIDSDIVVGTQASRDEGRGEGR